MDNKFIDFQDNKESLDHVREQLNKSESILSEESIRDIIRKEVIQSGISNQEQRRNQSKNDNQNINYENKKVQFSDNVMKQSNKTRLMKDLQEFDGHQIRNRSQFNDFNSQQQQMSEDLRNTVLFEEIPNQKQKIKQFNNSLWDEILLFYEKNDLNSCYQIVLDEEDDVYLIKLMMLTGPCLKYLDINNSKRLMSRLCMILDKVFEHSLSERILDNLTPIEQKKLTNEVYKLSSSSNPQVGEQSADLYIRLSQKFSQNY